MNRASLDLPARTVQIAFLAIAAGAWYFAAETRSISALFLPPPRLVFETFGRLVHTSAFWSSVAVTITTVLKAYVLAGAAGMVAGYLVTRSQIATQVFEPIVAGLFTIPITLFFPMFILFFGIGTGSKVAYGATYAFFPIALNTIAALSRGDELYLRAARSMGAGRFDILRHVIVPSALPVLATGLRIGFFICFASVLGGETISSVAGMGRAIALSAELMDPARMYAWILFVILTSVVMNLLIHAAETRVGGR